MGPEAAFGGSSPRLAPPAPSIPASSPATAQEPASLQPSSALGAPRLPQARAALAIGVALLTPTRLLFWTLHPHPAEPMPATPASDTRPQTNGPAAEEAAEGAPKPRDRSLCAPATRPSLPRPYRDGRELRDPSPLEVIRQIRKISPLSSRLVNGRHLPGFPGPRQAGRGGSEVPAGRGGPSPRPLSWPAPPRTRGSSARDSRAPPPRGALRPRRPRLPPGKGNWRESASRANTRVPSPTSHAPGVRGFPATLVGAGTAAHAPQRAPRPGRKLLESSPQEHASRARDGPGPLRLSGSDLGLLDRPDARNPGRGRPGCPGRKTRGSGGCVGDPHPWEMGAGWRRKEWAPGGSWGRGGGSEEWVRTLPRRLEGSVNR